MFTSNANAVAVLYLAYFNRPADSEGFAYWFAELDGGASFFDVAQAFAGTEEAISTYPFLSAGAGGEATLLRGIFSNIYRPPCLADCQALHLVVVPGARKKDLRR